MKWSGPIQAHKTVHSITLDSRKVQEHSIFVALKGKHYDAHAFIPDALAKGAIAIICSEPEAFTFWKDKTGSVPFAFVQHPRRVASRLARQLYAPALHRLTCFAVTGTKGKTTTVHWIQHTLMKMGLPCARVGTLGIDPPWMDDPGLTTPEGPDLGAYAVQLIENNYTYLAIEASSIGLDQYRLDTLLVHTAAFTNLGHDHLDYHQTLENYFQAKKRLFDPKYWQLKLAVINVDDPYGKRLADDLNNSLPVYRIGLNCANPDFSLEIDTCQIGHIKGRLVGRYLSQPIPFKTRLGGLPNAYNFLTTFAILSQHFPSTDLPEVVRAMESFPGVRGRFERYLTPDNVQIIIDYAHTPESLESVLECICQDKPERVWVIFGCGGNRDREKRPRMGRVAAQYADRIILTDDNPRDEDPESIMADILQGIPAHVKGKVTIIHDRREAIDQTLEMAPPGTVILIAGKGHETYQIYGREKYPHSDQECVRQWLRKRNSVNGPLKK